MNFCYRSGLVWDTALIERAWSLLSFYNMPNVIIGFTFEHEKYDIFLNMKIPIIFLYFLTWCILNKNT